MSCSICHRPVAPAPAVPWAETSAGKMHPYAGSHEGGPYEPARLQAALAHLPQAHEVCVLLAHASARGTLIRLDERLRS